MGAYKIAIPGMEAAAQLPIQNIHQIKGVFLEVVQGSKVARQGPSCAMGLSDIRTCLKGRNSVKLSFVQCEVIYMY